jgi:signal recognition particle subunit SEC65
MKQVWFRGYEDKEARKKEVRSFTTAFEELREVLEKNYLKKESVRDYGEPNWELRQIAVNEYNQSLKDIIELITLTKD